MQYVVSTYDGNAYMSVWQEDGKSLLMQLHLAPNEPIVRLDIKALPALLRHLASVHNEVVALHHPELEQASDIVSEGADQPATDLGESW